MSSKNGYISCTHIEQFKENKNGLKMYKLIYSSLIAICNQDARKQKVNLIVHLIVLILSLNLI